VVLSPTGTDEESERKRDLEAFAIAKFSRKATAKETVSLEGAALSCLLAAPRSAKERPA
jgi:hypothetical protein